MKYFKQKNQYLRMVADFLNFYINNIPSNQGADLSLKFLKSSLI